MGYPEREGRLSAGFGYASDMMAIAVGRDDAEAFMKFMEECGGVDCEVLISGSVINYAATHGAVEYVKAVFAAGGGKDYPLEYWLKKTEKPPYGPNAAKLI